MVHIIMCACDDDFSGGIGHDELNSDVCMAITQYEVSQEDFGHCDTNDDGEIDLDEALAAIEKYQNESTGRALTAFNRDNFFSNDGKFDQAFLHNFFLQQKQRFFFYFLVNDKKCKKRKACLSE